MEHQCTSRESQILLRAAYQLGSTVAKAAISTGAPAIELSADPASGKFVRSIIKARSARRQFFDGSLFSDPAWDILLELYALKCEGLRVSVSKLSVAADVPCTTALRWIDKLETELLIVRADDPFDGRRSWVELSDGGVAVMHRYLRQIACSEVAI